MAKRVITSILSASDVALILAGHALQQREIEIVPGTRIEAEMLAVFEKDGRGNVGITQYRVEVTVDELKESWRG